MGGFQSWVNIGENLETDLALGGNVIYKGGDIAQPTTDAGTGKNSIARTGSGAPARVPLALSDIDLAMQRIYQNGGKANKLMLSPKLRRDFSDLMVTDSALVRASAC